MKLFLNAETPFSRVVLAAAVHKQLADRILLQWVDPWSNPQELLEVNPLGQIPVLVSEGSLVLTETLCICQHLDRIGTGDLLYMEHDERIHLLNRLGFVIGMMDKAYHLATLERFHGSGTDVLTKRSQDALERMHTPVMNYMTELDQNKSIDLADIGFVATMEYMELRLNHLPMVEAVMASEGFKHLQSQDCLSKTKIPILQAMEQNEVTSLAHLSSES